MDDLVQVNTMLYERVQQLDTLVEAQAKQLEQQRVESLRQAETLSCLTEIMEDTMPIDVGHELIASVRAEAAATGRNLETRVDKVEHEVLQMLAVEQPLAPAKVPPSATELQRLERGLAGYSETLGGAEQDIVELSRRIAALESKHHSAKQKLDHSTEHRIVALESAASRVSAEAARRAEQSCQKVVAEASSKADMARRDLNVRIDRLADELKAAIANIQRHSAEAEEIATGLEGRTEDCAALLKSSTELNARLGQLEHRQSTADGRQERNTVETRDELQKVYLKLTERSVFVTQCFISLSHLY